MAVVSTNAMPDALKKAAVLAGARYEAPKVLSYALDDVKPLDQMASTGNG
jgi:hypothetical protein